MSFEPQKFFIGVMDFFSILLPGAILTWLFKDPVLAILSDEDGAAALDGAEAWIAFGIISYLAGHLLFLIGSWLDLVYDLLRRRTINRQIERALRGDDVSPRFVRAMVWLVFKRERDLAVARAGDIKEQALDPLSAANAVNTYQWSKAFLNAESPSALAAVQRVEADSKFFRCFTVLLLVLLLLWWWWQPHPVIAVVVLLVLLPLSFWRFMDQRFKATNQAYWFVIAITAQSAGKTEEQPDEPAKTRESEPGAGGVVYRERSGRIEYLLVEAKERKRRWAPPHGPMERGEKPRRAAVRHVHEQTGVWAAPEEDLGPHSWQIDDDTVTAGFFLMRHLANGVADDRRSRAWLPLEDACARASQEQITSLLIQADRRLELAKNEVPGSSSRRTQDPAAKTSG
jgi:ADP-ribose pyrophosphatase YjhB (NUDIX family)